MHHPKYPNVTVKITGSINTVIANCVQAMRIAGINQDEVLEMMTHVLSQPTEDLMLEECRKWVNLGRH